jgi:hypothetical protein
MVVTGETEELMVMEGMEDPLGGLVRVVTEEMVGMDLNRNRVALEVRAEMVD